MAEPIQPPAPNADAQEIFNYLTTVDAVSAQAWVKNNLNSLPEDVYYEVRNKVRAANAGQATSMYGTAPEAGTLTEIDKQLSVRGEANADENKVNKQKQQAVDQLVEQGVDEQTAQQQIEQAFDPNYVPLPELLLRGSGFQGQPTEAEQAKLIQAWNEFYPDQPISNFKELANRVNQGKENPTVQQVVEYGFSDTEPIVEYKYDFGATKSYLPNGQLDYSSLTPQQSVSVSADQFAALQKIYGGRFGHKDLKQLALMANQIGVKDTSGGNGWQILAAIAAGLGFFGDTTDAADASQAAMDKVPWEARDPLAKPTAQAASDQKARLAAKEMEIIRGRALKWKEGLVIYGQNDALAYLHAINPTLASNIANTPAGKPIDPAAAKKANQLFLNSGFTTAQLQSMGYAALNLEDYANYQDAMAAYNQSAQGPVRQMPDPDAIRQNAKDLWVQLYASEPTDAQLDKIVSATTQAILSADIDSADGMVSDVNANAQIRKAVEGDPQYKELYGNKPGGLSESEYQGQFRAGAASILGNQAADPSVIRSGMRTGQYQTAVGAAAMSSQARDNSTWLGRLAQAGEIVSANT